MIDLPIGVAPLRAAFPDGHIIDDGERRFAVSDTPADLAIRLAALEYLLRITPKQGELQGLLPTGPCACKGTRSPALSGGLHAFSEPFSSTTPFFIMKSD